MKLEQGQSKYLYIYESLVSQIRETESDAPQYLPSERTLSQKFGVDRLTVRKALDLLVKEGLIQKRPGKSTLILYSKENAEEKTFSKTVAFILPQGKNSVDRITEPFNAKLLYLIENELKSRGYDILYATVKDDGSLPTTILQNNACGIIFVSQIPEKAIQETKRTKLPAVVINRLSKDFPMVLEDRYQGFLDLLEYFFEIGHRNILFINGEKGYYTTDTCEIAFREFVERHAQDAIEARMISSYWNFASGKEVMSKTLQEGSRPTAICSCNDMVALGAMEAARQEGFQIPDQMSFAGFDDSDQCNLSTPHLSTVSANIPIIARYAVERIFSIIDHKNTVPEQTIIPTRFIPRGSIRIMR